MGHRQYACGGQQASLCDACICKHDVTWKVSDLLVGSVSLLSFSSHYQVDELHNAPRRAHTNSIAAGLPSKTVCHQFTHLNSASWHSRVEISPVETPNIGIFLSTVIRISRPEHDLHLGKYPRRLSPVNSHLLAL